MTAKPVICVGCAFWDTIFKLDRIPGHGAKVLPERAVQAAAGMATAAAVSIARLGGTVELWTRIGDDAIGTSFLKELAEEGVGTTSVRQVAGARTPFSTILVDRDGERLVVPYTDPELDPDPGWLPLDRIGHASAVLVDMRWPEGAREALVEARRHGVPAVIDADVAPRDVLLQLIALGDHVLFSEPALRSVTSGGSIAEALVEIASGLRALVVGVTTGADGALIREEKDPPGLVHRFSTIKVEAVDTLGAGDVWHGAYAFGVSQGWPLARGIETANVAAAMKCEHFGGRLGAPRMHEVVARMKEEPLRRGTVQVPAQSQPNVP